VDLDEYITITEAAQLLSKTVSMIGRLCRSGKFPGATKKGNAAWLIPRVSVESYSPGKRGPRTKKERLSAELDGIRAEIKNSKEV
jgi:hypothetical protein